MAERGPRCLLGASHEQRQVRVHSNADGSRRREEEDTRSNWQPRGHHNTLIRFVFLFVKMVMNLKSIWGEIQNHFSDLSSARVDWYLKKETLKFLELISHLHNRWCFCTFGSCYSEPFLNLTVGINTTFHSGPYILNTLTD